MPRYLVVAKRHIPDAHLTPEDILNAEPGVTTIQADNPRMITIDASEDAADRLRLKLRDTHFVEPEVRRSLQ
jgi:hypothetical protein